MYMCVRVSGHVYVCQSEQSCICVLEGINFASVYTILPLDFGNVLQQINYTLSEINFCLLLSVDKYPEFPKFKNQFVLQSHHGCDRMVVVFITTYAISAYHH